MIKLRLTNYLNEIIGLYWLRNAHVLFKTSNWIESQFHGLYPMHRYADVSLGELFFSDSMFSGNFRDSTNLIHLYFRNYSSTNFVEVPRHF